MAVITLLTDFGTSDEYVGIMKGMIMGIDPMAVIVDRRIKRTIFFKKK